ncbi:Flavastacin precursor [Aquisphaera giovannonii]|uniref:Flavastacin n=1 Tax=Aquisphaera giovannonii TaxID=406548 RepID=A0A5B9W474_9BACT|nr:M12 family metallopeptidase [Aquisphaera giovannonii]QEH34999.1 Flavastacin precursor [Aquisphaera giovannonii]
MPGAPDPSGRKARTGAGGRPRAASRRAVAPSWEPLESRLLPSCVVSNIWPTNQIPYAIDPSIAPAQAAVIAEAIDEYHDMTTVQWVPRAGQASYVLFRSEGYSLVETASVGYNQAVDYVDVSSAFDASTGVPLMLHEMGHVLGLLHEQQRYDRDDHVIVNWQAIDPAHDDAFAKVSNPIFDVGPYDVSSIMQYDSGAFSVGGRPAITRRDGSLIDQATTLSAEDVSTIDGLYPAPAGQAQVPRLVAAAGASPGEIDVSWFDTNGGRATYTVVRAAPGQAFRPIATLPAGSTRFKDGTAAAGTVYQYRVTSQIGQGTSPASRIVSAATIPAPPAGVAAAFEYPGPVTLSWSDPSGGLAGTRIERSLDGGPFSVVATLDPGATSYADAGAGLGAAGTAEYRVAAYYGQQVSASAPVQVVVSLQYPAPADLSAAAQGPSTVRLSWADASPRRVRPSYLLGSLVERSLDGSAFQPIAAVAAGTASFVDPAVPPGSLASYRVVVNGARGGTAAVAVAMPQAPPIALTSSLLPDGTGALTLSWDDPTGGAATSFVEESLDGSSFATIATLGPGTTAYAVPGLAASGATYWFRVHAAILGPSSATPAWVSPDSNTVAVTPAKAGGGVGPAGGGGEAQAGGGVAAAPPSVLGVVGVTRRDGKVGAVTIAFSEAMAPAPVANPSLYRVLGGVLRRGRLAFTRKLIIGSVRYVAATHRLTLTLRAPYRGPVQVSVSVVPGSPAGAGGGGGFSQVVR